MKLTYVAAALLAVVAPLQGATPAAGPSMLAAATPPLLPGDPMAEVLPILEANYPDFNSLHYHPGDTLSDLLARSGGKLEIVSAPAAPASPIFCTSLPDSIEYWRFASFVPQKTWAEVASQVKASASKAEGAILDLRSNATSDLPGAAHVLSLFQPADMSLYRYTSSSNEVATPSPATQPQSPPRLVVVLTDSQTSGAAETLAGRLQADGALLIGAATSSAQPPYEEHKLLDGRVLRIAQLASATASPTHAVTPDITLTVDEHTEKAALMLIRDARLDEVIAENAPRPRLSEAALVAGQDPEWDAYLSSLEPKPVLLSLPRIHDAVLTAALDSVRAIRVSESAAPEPAAPDAAATPAPAAGSMQ